ncbi:MAG TPA: hypothetical protein VFE58_05650 [Tepidisphaeraceae bacterium]|jgi:hypothetical protein|nr:hypothetical protein [Tepidisphaeraceae bacterium]
MGNSWLPLKDADLLPFMQNMSGKITATPATYGLLPADATALAGYLTTFSTNLAVATAPATRTAVSVAAKDISKAVLVADARIIAKKVQANPAVTPDQKIALGLPVHKDTPTPIPAPSTKPMLNIVGNGGRTVKILIKDETTPTKKAKPPGYEGSAVYTYVPTAGEEPPADLTEWRFEGLATRGDFEIDYRPGDVGKTAYILANWLNPRGEAGPNCEPLAVAVAA